MDKKEYLHAINALKEKQEEFENKLEIIKDEINFTKKDYINRCAKFKKGDKIKYKFINLLREKDIEYSILNTSIDNKGNILYNIGNDNKAYCIKVCENLLIKVE